MSIDSSHYYNRDGTPAYEQPCKSKPGTMRPTTLADARKLDLVPSVTTVLDIVYEYGLENWKKNQIVEAAWEFQSDNIPKDVWLSKVLNKADEISRTAANKGSAIHDAIEQYLKTGKLAQCLLSFAHHPSFTFSL